MTRYRKSEKYRIARAKYYESKGRETSAQYYLKNKEKIIERSKARYANMRNDLVIDMSSNMLVSPNLDA